MPVIGAAASVAVMTVRRIHAALVGQPRRLDLTLAGLLAGLSILFSVTRTDGSARPTDGFSVALILVACAALLWRRTRPVTVLGVVMAAEFLQAGLNYRGTGWVALLIAGYSLGAWATARPVLVVGVASSVLVVGFVTLGWLTTENVPWQAVVSSTVLYGGSILLGDNLRRRREAAAALAERAERAERERELAAEHHVRQERARLARELHDVVAHSVSVMTVQAAGARRQLAADPQRAERAMRVVEETGRQAMVELRRILGVLRDDDAAEIAPQPRLADLGDLVARTELPVRVRLDGPLDDLPPGVELSAFRIVQEAITNIGRHAGPVGQVEVAVHRDDHDLRVVVDDDGRGAAAHGGERAGGHGLVGMRERVAMLAGTLRAGPRPGGGWRVEATIPLARP